MDNKSNRVNKETVEDKGTAFPAQDGENKHQTVREAFVLRWMKVTMIIPERQRQYIKFHTLKQGNSDSKQATRSPKYETGLEGSI